VAFALFGEIVLYFFMMLDRTALLYVLIMFDLSTNFVTIRLIMLPNVWAVSFSSKA